MKKTPQQYRKERQLFLLNTKQDEGYVYMITSPSFKNWIKIGKTGNIKDRFMQFNYSTPLRNFKLECVKETNKKSVAELLLLNKINENLGIERKGEWIKVKNVAEARYMFNKHRNRKVTLQDREKCYA
jgi:hypothetical protein